MNPRIKIFTVAFFTWCCAALVSAHAQSVEDLLDDLIEEQVQSLVQDQVLETIESRLESTLESALDQIDDLESVLAGVQEIVPDPTAPFFEDLDPSGQRIERGVLMVMTTPDAANALIDDGYDVRELRRLESLGRVLIRVAFQDDTDLMAAKAALVKRLPEAQIDFNHLYEGTRGPQGTEATAISEPKGYSRKVRVPIGMIDSAVAEHNVLKRARITSRDFVSRDLPRPQNHGTAVASILVGDDPQVRGLLPGAQLYAASVFFKTSRGAEVATSAALAQALDWLIRSRVRVINMSLTGPPNAILEAMLHEVIAQEIVVVAAVGNNGPIGKPLYPAAYSSVLGITAVDKSGTVYRYAARGPEVAFTCFGVDVAVARANGRYGLESGTSMASPVAAAVIAHQLAKTRTTPGRILRDLQAMASDLGDAGFDEVFGHGLLTPNK